MQGSDFNMIPNLPKWFWCIIATLLTIGLAAVIGGIVSFVLYLLQHVKIV